VLTGDFVYANKVEMVTVDEMAEIVTEIDAGGMKGLRDIGYFSEINNPTTEEVTKALDEVYIYLDRHLTDA
jgi:hypothetical protein